MSFKAAFWAILVPVIVLGGIYAGVFAPTEAAVVAFVYSTFVGALIYKELTWKKFYKSLFDTILINSITTFMVGFSMAFAGYLSIQQIPSSIAAAMLEITINKYLLLFIINLLFLMIGCLIDNISVTIILSPILLPIVTQLGMTPVTFGVMLTMNLAIGFVTPPYGINLFVASAVAGVCLGSMMKSYDGIFPWCTGSGLGNHTLYSEYHNAPSQLVVT